MLTCGPELLDQISLGDKAHVTGIVHPFLEGLPELRQALRMGRVIGQVVQLVGVVPCVEQFLFGLG